jgi:DNA-binding NarL/FixJ family response regulator
MWKDTDVKKIIARLKKCEPVERVAKAFNVNKGSIYALIHSRGFDLYSLKHQLPTPEEKVKKYETRVNAKLLKKKLRLQKIQERKERILATRQKQKAERTARLMRLADLWRQGLTCKEIGDLEGGLTRSRISQLLENYNKEFPSTPVLQDKRRPGKSSTRKKNMMTRGQTVLEYRQQGKNYTEISKLLGVSPTAAKNSLAYYCGQSNIPLPESESKTIKIPGRPKIKKAAKKIRPDSKNKQKTKI